MFKVLSRFGHGTPWLMVPRNGANQGTWGFGIGYVVSACIIVQDTPKVSLVLMLVTQTIWVLLAILRYYKYVRKVPT